MGDNGLRDYKMPRVVNGQLVASNRRYAIVVSRYNIVFTSRMLEGALGAIKEAGGKCEDVHITYVPGSYELPLACMHLAASGKFDAVIALGVIVRGDTVHDRIIGEQVASGIQEVMLHTGVPVGFGLITAENFRQVRERTTCGANKGFEAAIAAIEMANLLTEE